MRVLDNGVVELVQTGFQTLAASTQFVKPIDDIVAQRRKDGKPALILTDISGVTGHEAKVRDSAHQLLQSDFDGMAVVTDNNVTARLIGNWLVRLVGVGQRVQFFEHRDEALAWLLKRNS